MLVTLKLPGGGDKLAVFDMGDVAVCTIGDVKARVCATYNVELEHIWIADYVCLYYDKYPVSDRPPIKQPPRLFVTYHATWSAEDHRQDPEIELRDEPLIGGGASKEGDGGEADPLGEFREGAFFEVALSHSYNSNTSSWNFGDFSYGTLKEGGALVRTRAEAQALVDAFYETGEIRIFVCRQRYTNKMLSPEQKIFRFLAADPKENVRARRYDNKGRHFVSSRDPDKYRYHYSVSICEHAGDDGVIYAKAPARAMVSTPKGEFAVLWFKDQLRIRGPNYELEYTRGGRTSENATQAHSRETLAEIIRALVEAADRPATR